VPFHEAGYWVAKFLLQRGLAAIYVLAFLVAAFQFRPLCGERGLLPLSDYVDRRAFRERPSLLYLYPSDRLAAVLAWVGVGLSVLAFVGVPGLVAGTPGTAVVWALLWLLYLSFVNAGQSFYGFGWESMLLEGGFLAVFLGAPDVAAPVVVIWLFRWLLFRNMFGAGLIKLRGDSCWHDLTCLNYHYETQPMPNPVSWYAHHLPTRVHRFGVAVNHVAEVLVPFLYFAPQPVAAIAGLVTIAFQGWLVITGNFSWLNWLTIVLAASTLGDGVVTAVLPVAVPATAPVSTPLFAAGVLLAVLVFLLSYYPVRNMLSTSQRMNAAFDPLHLVNTYGAFGSITKTRYEVVVQGTDDETVTADTEWRTYTFKGKPTNPDRRPPQVAPYHLRLDWQLWFAAMTASPRRHPWFYNLAAKLLAGDEATLRLLRTNPFPDEPPQHVRALRYRYEFTDPDERAETGQYWTRERVGTYFDPVSLDDPRFRSHLQRRDWEMPDRTGD